MPSHPIVALIAVVARNGVIGRDNAMPWHLPEDLAHFKRTTLGQPVVMGRRTWESLPARFRPLPGRRNVVVTRDEQWRAEGATRAGSLDEALRLAGEAERIFVIGGGQIYAAALPLAQELHLTEIEADADGDTRFPDWPRDAYERVSSQPVQAANGLAIAFSVYRRRDP